LSRDKLRLCLLRVGREGRGRGKRKKKKEKKRPKWADISPMYGRNSVSLSPYDSAKGTGGKKGRGGGGRKKKGKGGGGGVEITDWDSLKRVVILYPS